MMLLVFGTIAVVPLLLPILLPELSVDAGALGWTLMRQLLLPMIGGAAVAHFVPDLNRRLQPWVARAGNIALYVVLVATVIGYLPKMTPIIRSGALILGLLFVLAAFGIGYLAGKGADHLEDVGGLATAQRNTAAAMLIATTSFEDPTVFVLITLVNTIGIVLLIALAKLLKGDNVRIGAL
jgi:BASS family bile acid:Na+ symporter